METKYQQTIQELETHLKDQIYFLRSSAYAYDKGNTNEAKRMALSLRILFHNSRSSKSLLDQLGILQKPILDTSIQADPKNVLSHSGLIYTLMTSQGVKFIPALCENSSANYHMTDFNTWWNATILVDEKKGEISRKFLVLSIADQDGGAHVDSKLNKLYSELSRKNSLGWFSSMNGEPSQPVNGAEHASIRQIAHEVLETIDNQYSPEAPESPQPSVYLASPTAVRVDEKGDPKQKRPNNRRGNKKIGRNEVCYCGSSKKFKYCHGKHS